MDREKTAPPHPADRVCGMWSGMSGHDGLLAWSADRFTHPARTFQYQHTGDDPAEADRVCSRYPVVLPGRPAGAGRPEIPFSPVHSPLEHEPFRRAL